MLQDRLARARTLLRQDGVLFCSIDWNEVYRLSLLLDEQFGSKNRIGDIVWRNARDNNPTRIATEHEFILAYAWDSGSTEQVWKNEFADAKELLLEEYERIKKDGHQPEAIQELLREYIRDNREMLLEVDRYKFVDSDGVYTGSQSVHNPHPGGYQYEIRHPDTQGLMRMPANGYRFPEKTMRRDFIEPGRLIYGPDEHRIVQIKLYLKDYKDSLRSVIDLDGRLGAYALNDLFGTGTNLFDNPKPPQLLRRLLSFGSTPDSIVCDFFAGSGATIQAVLDIARMTGVRMRYVAVEMEKYFDTVLKPRVCKLAYAATWKGGEPILGGGGKHLVKYIRLESYEDALNNLEVRRTSKQQTLLDSDVAQGASGFKEQYLLRYMLDVETKGSQSLLNVEAFSDPTSYLLKVKQPGSDESRETSIDLLETFNWLIGIKVQSITATQGFDASFGRDSEKRLQLKGSLKQAVDGQWWFRRVEGTTPDGRKALIVWRKLTGDLEQDNIVLDVWMKDRLRISTKDFEFDLIYVNGDNNLENLKLPDDTWKVRLIEEDFHRLMFDTEGI